MVGNLKTEELASLLNWMEQPECTNLYLKVIGDREVNLLEYLLRSSDKLALDKGTVESDDKVRGRILELRHFITLHDQVREELTERMSLEKPKNASELEAEEQVL